MSAKVVVFLVTSEGGRDSQVELRYLDSAEDVAGQVDALIAFELQTRQPGFQIGGVSYVVGSPVVVENLEEINERVAGQRAAPPGEGQAELLRREVEELTRERDELKRTIQRRAGGKK